jgi:hypothetical protein
MFSLKDKKKNISDEEDYDDVSSEEEVKPSKKKTTKKTKKEAYEYVKKEYTTEEKKDLIKNTIIIPEDRWYTLEPGLFISYDKPDGSFVKGGYIISVGTTKTNNRKYFKINFYQTDNSKGYTLYFDNIKTLYKKINETSYYELNAIREAYEVKINGLQELLLKQTTYKKTLEQTMNTRFTKVEDNLKKTLMKIKQLHNLS